MWGICEIPRQEKTLGSFSSIKKIFAQMLHTAFPPFCIFCYIYLWRLCKNIANADWYITNTFFGVSSMILHCLLSSEVFTKSRLLFFSSERKSSHRFNWDSALYKSALLNKGTAAGGARCIKNVQMKSWSIIYNRCGNGSSLKSV